MSPLPDKVTFSSDTSPEFSAHCQTSRNQGENFVCHQLISRRVVGQAEPGEICGKFVRSTHTSAVVGTQWHSPPSHFPRCTYNVYRPRYPSAMFKYIMKYTQQKVCCQVSLSSSLCSRRLSRPLLSLVPERPLNPFTFLPPVGASIQPRCGCRLRHRNQHPPPGGVF